MPWLDLVMIAPVAASTVPDGVAELDFAIGSAWRPRGQRLVDINHGAGKSTLDSAIGCV
jgi:hypothetical protein